MYLIITSIFLQRYMELENYNHVPIFPILSGATIDTCSHPPPGKDQNTTDRTNTSIKTRFKHFKRHIGHRKNAYNN